MARKFLTNIDLNQNQLFNAALQNLGSDPGSPVTGQIWFNTGSGLTKLYNGTAVIDPLNRANHSSTQLASTISNLATTVQGYTLNLFAAPVANITMAGYLINNLGTPLVSTDAANKGYVDASIAGLSWKEAAAAATTANLPATYNNGASGVGATLTNSGTQAGFIVDGYTANVNDYIVVKNQTTASQNGIYNVTSVGSGSTNWVLTRSTDSNSSANITGAAVYVDGGTTQTGIAYTQTAVQPTIGTTSITFTQFGGGAVYSAGAGLALSGNTFSVATGGVTNAMLVNSALTVTAGSGLSGGGAVSLGGSVTLTNSGVTSNVAGTGISVSGPTGAVTIGNTGVLTNVAGTGISVSGASGNVTINNTGVTAFTSGTGLSINTNAVGSVSVTNTGVLTNIAGTGISLSGSTGAVTITNIGVTSAIAGTGMGVSGSTGAITFTNTGVTSFTSGTGLSTNTSATGNVSVTNTGVTSIIAGTGISVSAATGSVTISTASGLINKYSTNFGDGSTLLYTITHSLGTIDVHVAVTIVSTGAEVEADVIHATTNTITVGFTVAPASNTVRVVVIG